MNHSINNFLWITLFTLLYTISTVNALCSGAGTPGVCTSCGSQDVCEIESNPGNDNCGCHWYYHGTPQCTDVTCDPTIDPTIDPTSDPTTDPTIDPTRQPTTNTQNPTVAPSGITSAPTGDDDDDDDDDDDSSSDDDEVAAALFEEKNELGSDSDVGSDNGSSTSVISLHFSNETLMNIWILFGVLIVVNIVFCFVCNRKKKPRAKIVEESSSVGGHI